MLAAMSSQTVSEIEKFFFDCWLSLEYWQSLNWIRTKLLHIMKKIWSFPLVVAEKQKVQKAHLTNFFHKKTANSLWKGFQNEKLGENYYLLFFCFIQNTVMKQTEKKINCIKFCLFTRTEIKVKLIKLSCEGWTGVRVRGSRKNKFEQAKIK